jgi:DNA-binding NtrC family response regulator
MSDKTVIHVIDDDAAMRDSLAFLLDVNGFAPKVYETADAFLDGINLASLACVISDIRMPGMNGIELVRKLKDTGSSCPVILITGHGDVALAVEAMMPRCSARFARRCRRCSRRRATMRRRRRRKRGWPSCRRANATCCRGWWPARSTR